MNKRGKQVEITMELVENLEIMLNQRMTLKQIGEKLNICRSSIHRISKDGGGFKNFNAKLCFEIAQQRKIRKRHTYSFARKRTKISHEILLQMKELINHGESQSDICKFLNISKSSIQRIIIASGGNKNFDAEKVIKVYEEKKLTKKQNSYDDFIDLQKIVNHLEMQMEIVLQAIKDIKEKQID